MIRCAGSAIQVSGGEVEGVGLCGGAEGEVEVVGKV